MPNKEDKLKEEIDKLEIRLSKGIFSSDGSRKNFLIILEKRKAELKGRIEARQEALKKEIKFLEQFLINLPHSSLNWMTINARLQKLEEKNAPQRIQATKEHRRKIGKANTGRIKL